MRLEGFDDCIIGECSRRERLIYNQEKIIEKLSETMTREEAIENFYFNFEGAYLEDGPIYMIKTEEEG